MIKIVFFAPYPDILPVIEQVFRERPESEAIRYEVIQDYSITHWNRWRRTWS